MFKGIRLIPDETHVNFVSMRFVAFALSAILIAGSIGLLVTRGLNFGVDFAGGIQIEVRMPEPADLAQLRDMVGALDLGEATLQQFEDPREVMIRVPAQEGGEDANSVAVRAIQDTLGDNVDYRRVEVVGPQVGAELIEAGILAVSLSLAGIMLYIWFRFEWQFGVAALTALAHDVIATIGLFSLTQMEFNLPTVAAALMIAGYSINDTVVVFDRVRETLRKHKSRELPAVFNVAINETLGRTLITSLTTMIALVALWVFGGEVIRSFVIALMWGIVIGTYSSIFVATPMLLFFDLDRGVAKPATTEAERLRAKAEITSR